jgi:hypothetical protein
MAFDIGFNFRGTFGYVDDNTGTTNNYFANDQVFYPTTYGTTNAGWVANYGAALTGIDRNSALDPRLAGEVFLYNETPGATWRIDLPNTGQYLVQLAFGDSANGSASGSKLEIQDSGTGLIVLGPEAQTAGEWFDAQNNLWTSAAAWVANEVTVAVNYVTSTLFAMTLYTAVGDYANLSHLHVTEVSSVLSRLPLLGVG